MDYKRIMKIFSIAITTIVVLIFLFVAISFSTFKTEILSAVKTYGYGAIFLVSLLLDILFQPFAPDVPLIGGILSGLNIYIVLLCVLAGSYTASILGYLIGNLYGEVGIKKVYGETRYNKWKKQYAKYGKRILLLAALTPVPYTPFCWISGIFKLKKTYFIIYAILARTIRFISVAYLTVLILAAA